MYTNCGRPMHAIELWEGQTDGGIVFSANEFICASVLTATCQLAVVPSSVQNKLTVPLIVG